MTTTPEDILDELSTIIMDLGAIREQITDDCGEFGDQQPD